jgi:tape measure domain-containing protein
VTTLATFDILLRGDTRQFEQSMGHAQQTSNSFIKNMAGIASGFVVANVAMKGFNMGLNLVKDSIVGYNARMEQAQIGFTTLLGSAEMAQSFVAELQHFAAVTPFDFPGLQQASTTMMAMGFAAQDVIPTLTAVGDVVAAMGKSGGEASESINRIVYNIGQMKQYGRVTGRDIRDLTMLGVPVVKILAAGFNKSTTAMQEMISKGVLPADKAIQVLIDGIEKGNMGGMMDAQAKTFNGAMSTIKDTVQQLGGTAFKPLFDAISKVTYAFSLWVQSPAGVEFANKIATAMRTLVIILERVAPAVIAFGKGIIDGFKVAYAYVRGFLKSMTDQFASTSKNLAVGGWNAVVAYAQGMMNAARTYLAHVVEVITDYIASYLIGQSPPEKGALSNIDAGGKAVIDAWVAGAMSANLTPITDIPKKIGSSLKALEASAKYIEDNLRAVSDQLAIVDLNMAKINITASRLKWAYEDAIGPLQKQYDLLQDTYSLSDKKRDLELALKKNALEQQIAAAKGNWWLTEQLQVQLDALDQQSEANRLLEEQQSLEAQIAGIPLEEQMKTLTDQYNAQMDPLTQQLTLLQRQREELQFQADVWNSIRQQIDQTVTALTHAASIAKGIGGGGGGGGGKGKKTGFDAGIPAPVKNIVPINEKLFGSKKEVEAAAQKMADTFIASFGNRLQTQWPTLLGAALGAIIGSVIPGVGTVWGATIGGMIGTLFSTQIKDAFSNGIKFIQDLLSGGEGLDWGQVFSLENILTHLSAFFQGVLDWIINTGVPTLAQMAGPMALTLVDWVGDAIPMLLAALPKVIEAVLQFVIENGPKIVRALLNWAIAFVGWIFSDLIPHLLPALGKVGLALLGFIAEMVPKLAMGMVSLGVRMVASLIDVLLSLPGKVVDIFVRMKDNILGLAPKFAAAVGKLGSSIAGALTGAIKSALNTLIRAINSFRIDFNGLDLGPLGKVAAVHWNGFNIPYFHKGAWDVPDDILANVGKGEMVLPEDFATAFRRIVSGGGVQGGTGSVIVNGPLVNIEHFTGSDSDVDDLMDKMASALRLRSA